MLEYKPAGNRNKNNSQPPQHLDGQTAQRIAKIIIHKSIEQRLGKSI